MENKEIEKRLQVLDNLIKRFVSDKGTHTTVKDMQKKLDERIDQCMTERTNLILERDNLMVKKKLPVIHKIIHNTFTNHYQKSPGQIKDALCAINGALVNHPKIEHLKGNLDLTQRLIKQLMWNTMQSNKMEIERIKKRLHKLDSLTKGFEIENGTHTTDKDINKKPDEKIHEYMSEKKKLMQEHDNLTGVIKKEINDIIKEWMQGHDIHKKINGEQLKDTLHQQMGTFWISNEHPHLYRALKDPLTGNHSEIIKLKLMENLNGWRSISGNKGDGMKKRKQLVSNQGNDGKIISAFHRVKPHFRSHILHSTIRNEDSEAKYLSTLTYLIKRHLEEHAANTPTGSPSETPKAIESLYDLIKLNTTFSDLYQIKSIHRELKSLNTDDESDATKTELRNISFSFISIAKRYLPTSNMHQDSDKEKRLILSEIKMIEQHLENLKPKYENLSVTLKRLEDLKPKKTLDKKTLEREKANHIAHELTMELEPKQEAEQKAKKAKSWNKDKKGTVKHTPTRNETEGLVDTQEDQQVRNKESNDLICELAQKMIHLSKITTYNEESKRATNCNEEFRTVCSQLQEKLKHTDIVSAEAINLLSIACGFFIENTYKPHIERFIKLYMGMYKEDMRRQTCNYEPKPNPQEAAREDINKHEEAKKRLHHLRTAINALNTDQKQGYKTFGELDSIYKNINENATFKKMKKPEARSVEILQKNKSRKKVRVSRLKPLHPDKSQFSKDSNNPKEFPPLPSQQSAQEQPAPERPDPKMTKRKQVQLQKQNQKQKQKQKQPAQEQSEQQKSKHKQMLKQKQSAQKRSEQQNPTPKPSDKYNPTRERSKQDNPNKHQSHKQMCMQQTQQRQMTPQLTQIQRQVQQQQMQQQQMQQMITQMQHQIQQQQMQHQIQQQQMQQQIMQQHHYAPQQQMLAQMQHQIMKMKQQMQQQQQQQQQHNQYALHQQLQLEQQMQQQQPHYRGNEGQQEQDNEISEILAAQRPLTPGQELHAKAKNALKIGAHQPQDNGQVKSTMFKQTSDVLNQDNQSESNTPPGSLGA